MEGPLYHFNFTACAFVSYLKIDKASLSQDISRTGQRERLWKKAWIQSIHSQFLLIPVREGNNRARANQSEILSGGDVNLGKQYVNFD